MTEEKKEQDVKADTKPVEVPKEEKGTENTQTQTQSAQTQVNSNMKYSGFWVRGAALFIDSLVVAVLMAVAALPIMFIVMILSFIPFLGVLAPFAMFFAGLIVAWGYFIFMTYKYKATLGKMAVGVEVVTEDNLNLSLGSVTLRETIGKIVSALIFYIGYIMAAFTKKKQSLHDMMAHSVVVYKDPAKGANTVVVIIVYVVWGIMAFIAFILALFFGAVLAAMLTGLFGMSQNTDSYLDNIEDTIMQDLDDNYGEWNDDMMIDVEDVPMNVDTDGMQELEQMLQNLDMDMSNTY
jgi:uncharacterized RDD family membrane protein YckC